MLLQKRILIALQYTHNVVLRHRQDNMMTFRCNVHVFLLCSVFCCFGWLQVFLRRRSFLNNWAEIDSNLNGKIYLDFYLFC